MKQTALILSACLVGSSLAAQDKPARPKITGIDHVRIYVSNLDNARSFYGKTLGLPSDGGGCVGVARPCYPVNWYQQIELEQA
ncbi:MAG: VOC family protein, partial [Candidatus Acidiferrum sp.]